MCSPITNAGMLSRSETCLGLPIQHLKSQNRMHRSGYAAATPPFPLSVPLCPPSEHSGACLVTPEHQSLKMNDHMPGSIHKTAKSRGNILAAQLLESSRRAGS